MPLYEYQCDACGHRFESIQKFSDPPLETCPRCGGALRKLQAAPAFQFKGSGWYITDYAKKEAAPAGKTDKAEGGAAGPGTADAAKPDPTAKPESKPEPAAAKTDKGTG